MKKVILFLILAFQVSAQKNDTKSAGLKEIYSQALKEQQGYLWLGELCAMGPRFAGTEQATASLLHFKEIVDSLGFKTTLQAVKVPRWVRGPQEKAWLMQGIGKTEMAVTALGGSIATPLGGLKAAVVEINSFESLDTMDLSGKIAFFNIPMDPTYISTGFAYGSAVKQRWAGAMEASKKGAIGVVIRSLSSSINKFPHTGSMAYAPEIKKIPAAALSTFDAELLSKTLKTDPDLQVKLEMACEWQDSVYSFNLIADLVGSEKPDEIILVSGHFDSWELGTGAHDDGAGAMHALESIYLLKDLKFPIKRTLRLVWYMNEEFGLSGARVYAKAAKKETTKRHVIAMESDGGGFTPKGISIQASSDMVLRLKEYRSLFEPYGVYQFASGGSGADIGQLKSDDIVLIGLRPDNHRYFEVHHSALDNFAAVNAREFTMGSATLAALVWLMDQDDLCVDCAQ
jgi:hypothetical protein